MLVYCLLIETVLWDQIKNVYKELFKYKQLFDFSEYQWNLFYPTDKKATGKMKDEFKGIPINKFIGLKPKTYCIVSDDDTKVNTAKGVNISIEFIECEDVLFNEKIIRHKMKRIQSRKH